MQDPPKKFLRHSSLPLLLLALLPPRLAQAGDSSSAARLEVDAREISRKMLHAREELPAKPGPLVLWFPKWIPGTHAPGGPIQNIGGLRLETPDGKPISGRRDETEVCRLECTVPDDVDRIVVRLDYICNQP